MIKKILTFLILIFLFSISLFSMDPMLELQLEEVDRKLDHYSKELVNFYEEATRKVQILKNYEMGVKAYIPFGTLEENEESISWFKKCTEAGYIEAYDMIELIYDQALKRRQKHTDMYLYYFGNKISMLMQLASRGDYKAQYYMGVAYIVGEKIHQDSTQGLYWIKKSAKTGYPEAEYALAVIYGDDQLSPTDEEKELFWVKRSANHGYNPAQYSLGKLYLEGESVEKQEEKGIYWIRKSANQGNEEAKKYLMNTTRKKSML